MAGELKARGFVVHRTDAVHSPSAYLKLDWGMANTVRISDHYGSGDRLNFRFNVVSDVTEPYITTHDGDIVRHWYGFNHLGQVIRDIEALRSNKVAAMGDETYAWLMDRNRVFASDKPQGMFKKARRV